MNSFLMFLVGISLTASSTAKGEVKIVLTILRHSFVSTHRKKYFPPLHSAMVYCTGR